MPMLAPAVILDHIVPKRQQFDQQEIVLVVTIVMEGTLMTDHLLTNVQLVMNVAKGQHKKMNVLMDITFHLVKLASVKSVQLVIIVPGDLEEAFSAEITGGPTK